MDDFGLITLRAYLGGSETALDAEVVSATYTASVGGGDGFSIGNACSAELVIVLADAGTTAGNQSLRVTWDAAGTEYPLFTGTVSKATTSGSQTTITAYDALDSASSTPYEPAITGSCTAAEALADIAAQMGVELDGDTKTLAAGTALTEGISALEGPSLSSAAANIALLLGGNAVITRAGALAVRQFADCGWETESYAGGATPEDTAYTVDGLTFQRTDTTTATDEDGITTETSTSTDYTASASSGAGLTYSTNLATQALVDGAYEALAGLSFRAGSFSVQGGLFVEPGDLVTVDGLTVAVSSISLSLDGGCKTAITSLGQSDTSSTGGSLTQAISAIQQDYAEFKTMVADNISATNANFTNVLANYIKADELEATVATFGYLTADSAVITDLTAKVATIDAAYITAAYVENLLAGYTTTEYLEANYATIGSLNAATANITDLTAEVANINSILAGNVGAGTIQTVHLTSENVVIDDAVITDAMIVDLTASKITSGTIYTSLVTIQSESGNLYITDNTIQIQDDSDTVRVQIGEDASGDYNLYLWDASGNLLWDAGGLYAAGIHDGIIKDIAVAEDAAISGSKLDIASVASELNKDGSLTVNAAQVTIDDTTLKYRLTSMTTATDEAQAAADAAAAAAAELESEAVSSLTQYYALGTSDAEPPSDPADNVTRAPALVDTAIVDESQVDIVYSDTEWTTDWITASDGLYLWTAFYVEYADGHTGWTTPTCLTDGVARETTSTLVTELEVVQGQITAKVWQTDIDSAVDELGADITTLSDKYASLTLTIDGITTEVADIKTTVSDNYETLESKITTVETTASGISTTVSDLQTTVGENYTELSNKITTVETTASGISATVSSVQSGLSDLSDTVDGTVTGAVTYFAISGDTEPPCDPGEDIVDATVDTAIVDSSRVGCVGWTTERPTVGEDEYLWMCYQLTLADGSTVWTEPVLVTDDYMRTSMASLTITADAITAEVSTLAGELSEVEQTAASLKSKVQSNFDVLSSEITQLADSIELCVTTDSDTGYLRLGTGDDSTVKFTVDTDNFTIDESGNVTMAGKVTATSGTVGGWNINSQKIYGTAADGTTTAVMQISGLTEDTAYVFACGGTSHSSYADCPFRVNKIGGMWVQDVIVAEGLVAGTNISATGNVYATALVGDNDGGLYCKDTEGTARRVAYLSTNDNMVLGNSNFPTYLYGTTIYANDQRVKEVQHGNVAISVSAADTPTSVEVTFPTVFSGVPDVVVSAATSSPATSFVGVLSPSATGCTIYLTRTTTGEITVRWMAAY